MRSNFKQITLPLFLLLIILLLNTTTAQIIVDVTVRNYDFNPSSITIAAGDTVRWTNIQGNHNVNGRKDTFPSNPTSFGNVVSSPGWVYTYVFDVPGFYNYQCDPHLIFGMVGDINVLLSGNENIIHEKSEATDRAVLAKKTERIGEIWEWFPVAKKLSENNLAPKEERIFDFSFTPKKTGNLTLSVEVTKHRLNKKSADANQLKDNYPLYITVFDSAYSIAVQ